MVDEVKSFIFRKDVTAINITTIVTMYQHNRRNNIKTKT